MVRSKDTAATQDEVRRRRPRSIPTKLAEYSMNVDFVVDALSSSSPQYAESSKSELKNRDICECCGDGGDLLCCDNCPASFHFVCVDPPMEASAVPTGDWYCKECAVKKNPSLLSIPKPAANLLVAPLLRQLVRTNPRVFTLPAELHSVATSERAARIAEHNKKDSIVSCLICTVDGVCSELLNCAICGGSYHTYCMDPPLLNKPLYWVCQEHDGAELPHPKGIKRARTDTFHVNGNISNGKLLHTDKTRREQVHFLPGDTFRLNFPPVPYNKEALLANAQSKVRSYSSYSCDPADDSRDARLEKFNDIDGQTPIDEQTSLLLNLSNNRPGERVDMSAQYVDVDSSTDGLDIYTSGVTGPSAHNALGQHGIRIDAMLREQRRLFHQAMPDDTQTTTITAPPTTAATSSNNNNSNDTPLMLSQLTPLFTQFLAWQRLMQVNQQLAIASGVPIDPVFTGMANSTLPFVQAQLNLQKAREAKATARARQFPPPPKPAPATAASRKTAAPYVPPVRRDAPSPTRSGNPVNVPITATITPTSARRRGVRTRSLAKAAEASAAAAATVTATIPNKKKPGDVDSANTTPPPSSTSASAAADPFNPDDFFNADFTNETEASLAGSKSIVRAPSSNDEEDTVMLDVSATNVEASFPPSPPPPSSSSSTSKSVPPSPANVSSILSTPPPPPPSSSSSSVTSTPTTTTTTTTTYIPLGIFKRSYENPPLTGGVGGGWGGAAKSDSTKKNSDKRDIPTLESLLEGTNIRYPNSLARLETTYPETPGLPPQPLIFNLYKKGTIMGRSKNTTTGPDVNLFVLGTQAKTVSHYQAYFIYSPTTRKFKLVSVGRNPTKLDGKVLKPMVPVTLPKKCVISSNKIMIAFTQLQS